MDETLYSLAEAERIAIEGGFVIDEDTGEVIWDSSNLEELGLALADKAERVLAVQRDYDAKAKMADAEIKRLQSLKKAYVSHSEWLKLYMRDCVEANGKAIETPIGRLSLRKSSKVDVFDVREVPGDYMRYKYPEPDKALIRNALKSGTHVPGCALVESTSLQIR